MFFKASGAFGITVEDPQWVEVHDTRNEKNIIEEIKYAVKSENTEIVVVILGNKAHKPNIKKLLDSMGIPS